MKAKRIMVVAGGDLERDVIDELMPTIHFIIAADAGSERLLAWGIIPDVVVGDFDSSGPEVIQLLDQLGVTRESLPEAKNETDLHVALMKALDHNPQEIVIVGALGGARYDHMLANIGLMEWLAEHRVDAVMLNQTNRIRFLQGPGTCSLQNSTFTYVSLIPITRTVEGVMTEGLKYPLRSETLIRGQTRGISNELEEKEATVTIKRGKLLIMESKEH